MDLTRVTGSGPGGRIVEEDVRRAAGASASGPRVKIVPVSAMRRTIARRMYESLAQMAQVTFTCEVDMGAIQEERRKLLEGPAKQRVSYAAAFLKATAEALIRYPMLNASLVGEEAHLFQEVNVGFAVPVDDGLVVPVVKRANEKDLIALSREMEELSERAKTGKLGVADVADGTFTISVLGGVVDSFTPIINPPQVGILGFGRTAERPVAHQGQIALRPMVTVSLTVDHRLVDGEMAAGFLRRLKQLLERPDSLTQTAGAASA